MLKLVLLYFVSLKVSFQKPIDDVKCRFTVLEIDYGIILWVCPLPDRTGVPCYCSSLAPSFVLQFFRDRLMLTSSIFFPPIPLPLGQHFFHTQRIFILERTVFCLRTGTLYILFSLPVTLSPFPFFASQIPPRLSCINLDTSFRKFFLMPSLGYIYLSCVSTGVYAALLGYDYMHHELQL